MFAERIKRPVRVSSPNQDLDQELVEECFNAPFCAARDVPGLEAHEPLVLGEVRSGGIHLSKAVPGVPIYVDAGHPWGFEYTRYVFKDGKLVCRIAGDIVYRGVIQ